MNIFKPYTIIPEADNKLHLKLPSSNKTGNILVFRILPVFILTTLLTLLLFMNDGFTLKIYIGLFLVFIITFQMFLTKIVTDIYFTENEIEIHTLNLFRNQSKSYFVSGISHIHLLIYTAGRGRGAYYNLIMKDEKKVHLFNLPIFWNFDKEKIKEVNRTLTNKSNLKIEEPMGKLN